MIDTTGKVKPCCRFVLDNSAEELNLQSKSIHEIFHSDFMNSLREKSAMGEKIPGCRRCYEEQAGGKRSLRERVNGNSATNVYDLNTPKINYLELAISNDCNLMCRMCSSRFSHKLFDEELQYYGKTQIPEKKTRSNIDAAYNLLDNLLYIKFTGGEPLLIKEHWELLQEAVDRDLAKKITLNYSTNCTILKILNYVLA
jgi:MoaA/NifB/PqqE/SkfB family radical SAM enzyme